MEKLQKNLGGIREMKRLPGAVFVVDPRKKELQFWKQKIRYSYRCNCRYYCDQTKCDCHNTQ